LGAQRVRFEAKSGSFAGYPSQEKTLQIEGPSCRPAYVMLDLLVTFELGHEDETAMRWARREKEPRYVDWQ
jgi:hypothetical protein